MADVKWPRTLPGSNQGVRCNLKTLGAVDRRHRLNSDGSRVTRFLVLSKLRSAIDASA